MTQFGRALSELNIEILCAKSSQAKGRVERASRTLQDRLVKELRLAGVNDMAADNALLPVFVERFNHRFSVRAANPEDLHRSVNVATSRLSDILCHREQRHVWTRALQTYRSFCWAFMSNIWRRLIACHKDLYLMRIARLRLQKSEYFPSYLYKQPR